MTRPSGLRLMALAVLLLHAWAVLTPAVHEAAEAREHGALRAAAPEASTLAASCDPDCDRPGHAHHSHDPGTCSACRVLVGPLVAPGRVVLQPVAPGLACRRAHATASILAGCGASASSRGPPSRLS